MKNCWKIYARQQELSNPKQLTTCMRRHFKYDFSVRCNRSTVTLRYGSTQWSTCPLQFWKTTSMSLGAGSMSESSKFLSDMTWNILRGKKKQNIYINLEKVARIKIIKRIINFPKQHELRPVLIWLNKSDKDI